MPTSLEAYLTGFILGCLTKERRTENLLLNPVATVDDEGNYLNVIEVRDHVDNHLRATITVQQAVTDAV